MPANERVIVTLPADLVRDIDRLERDRSKFLQEAARHELERRRREHLRRSLHQPHPESTELVEVDFDEWATTLPDEDAAELVDPRAGRDVHWVPGEGWTKNRS